MCKISIEKYDFIFQSRFLGLEKVLKQKIVTEWLLG